MLKNNSDLKGYFTVKEGFHVDGDLSTICEPVDSNVEDL